MKNINFNPSSGMKFHLKLNVVCKLMGFKVLKLLLIVKGGNELK